MSKPEVKQLKAKQLIGVQTPEGYPGLLMVSIDGSVYMKVDGGWLRLEMNEVENDTKV